VEKTQKLKVLLDSFPRNHLSRHPEDWQVTTLRCSPFPHCSVSDTTANTHSCSQLWTPQSLDLRLAERYRAGDVTPALRRRCSSNLCRDIRLKNPWNYEIFLLSTGKSSIYFTKAPEHSP